MSTVRHFQSPLMNAHRPPVRETRSPLALVLGIIVGAVFIYAGALKIVDPVKFATDIANFHVLPWWLGVRVAFYLPWLEVICGLALIVGWLRSGAVGILTALTVIFIAATVAAKVRGINLDCGCFGSATKNLTFAWHMVIDFALLAALLALGFWPRRTPGL